MALVSFLRRRQRLVNRNRRHIPHHRAKERAGAKEWTRRNGNYDYLLANDIDVDNPEVADELKRWGRWVVKEFGFDGFRMDAVKHIDHNFIRDFLTEVRKDKRR